MSKQQPGVDVVLSKWSKDRTSFPDKADRPRFVVPVVGLNAVAVLWSQPDAPTGLSQTWGFPG